MLPLLGLLHWCPLRCGQCLLLVLNSVLMSTAPQVVRVPTLCSLPTPTWELSCDFRTSCLGWAFYSILPERVSGTPEPAFSYLYNLIFPFCSACWPWHSTEDIDSLLKFCPGYARASSGCLWTPLKHSGSFTLWPWSGYSTFHASISSGVNRDENST